MQRGRAFSLVELLVVVAILALLLSILSPSLRRAVYHARSARCGSNMHQIGLGMSSYASANDSYYPARHPKANTYNHAYWFGQVGKADQDLHEQFEKYLGGAADGRPPAVLVCAVQPRGIWGREIPWPLGSIYRTNVAVYAGYDWSTASASCCQPHHPLDQMPQKIQHVPHRPIAGDLTEYMSGNSTQGYSGWNTSHSSDPRYHARGAGGPEAPPPDPIPFAFGDGSVRFTRDLEPCYTDPGWGTNYWAAP